MKRILWMSQHKPVPSQITALEQLFGEVRVEPDENPFDSAEVIVRRYQEDKYDDIVVVAPLSVIARLVELGIKPLWAEMKQVFNRQEAEVEAKGRWYKFERFRRIKRLNIEFEELDKPFRGWFKQ